MHAAAVSLLYVALLGQTGGDYGNYGDPPAGADLGPKMSVSAGARTRSTRATAANPLTGSSYPASRVATNPRYAAPPQSNYETGLPPVGDSSRMATEDPQSALASKLLRDMLQPTRADQNVQALRLVDALERAQGSQQQFTAIKAYWEWSLSVSELHGVLEEDAALSRLGVPRAAHEQAAHTANRKASRSRLEDSQLDVAAKVVDLLETTGYRATSTIRPADVPFVSTYNTNFSRIFPGTSAPGSLKKIHQTLPYALKVVRSRGDSYESARQALGAAQEAYQKGQCPYDDFVNAIGLVRSQRRAFLDSVHDYNFAIAEYALSIAGPGLGRETVVSMLIRTAPAPYRGAAVNNGYDDVLPVSGTQEEFSSGNWGTYYGSTELERPTLDALPAGISDPMPAAIRDLGNQPVRRQSSTVLLR